LGFCEFGSAAAPSLVPSPASGSALSAMAASSAWRLRCGPHISSFKSGGAASIGVSALTLPKAGNSQANGLRAKPLSKSSAAFCARAADVGAPSTTTMSCRLSRVAVATRLKPEEQIKPVFMPSAPA
jgi:hypothetical protein